MLYRSGPTRDDQQASFFYELAAERGSAPACMALGHFYEKGMAGVHVDWERAYAYYSLAAGLSASDAMEHAERARKAVRKGKR